MVGLTGGIGSGKSAAAQRFADLGVGVIDTDLIAHQLTAPGGAGLAPLLERFGPGVFTPDGRLDRGALRSRVFQSTEDRKALEAILHPLIRGQVASQLTKVSGVYAVVVVPLLIETGGYATLCDRVLVIDCTEQTQIARTMRRSQLSEAQVRAIMSAQASRHQRLAAADDVVLNEGTLEELNAKIDDLHRAYLDIGHATQAGNG